MMIFFTLTEAEASGSQPVSFDRFIKQIAQQMDTQVNASKRRQCTHNGYQPLNLAAFTSHIKLIARCKSPAGMFLQDLYLIAQQV